jgi:hypothetical protein
MDVERLGDVEGEQRTQHMDGGKHREHPQHVPERCLVQCSAL